MRGACNCTERFKFELRLWGEKSMALPSIFLVAKSPLVFVFIFMGTLSYEKTKGGGNER